MAKGKERDNMCLRNHARLEASCNVNIITKQQATKSLIAIKVKYIQLISVHTSSLSKCDERTVHL